jgi:hypothetical protein
MYAFFAGFPGAIRPMTCGLAGPGTNTHIVR